MGSLGKFEMLYNNYKMRTAKNWTEIARHNAQQTSLEESINVGYIFDRWY